MMFGHYGFGWVGFIVSSLITIALIVGFVWLIVWAVRRMSGSHMMSGSMGPSAQNAREIAKARYAKGEITRDEYQQILTDLDK